MSIEKEALPIIPSEAIVPLGQEKLELEQVGLKELCSSTDLMGAKRGGREPGVHKWGR